MMNTKHTLENAKTPNGELAEGISETSAVNERCQSSTPAETTIMLSVGSKLPSCLSQAGAYFEWGDGHLNPTFFVGLENPHQDEIMALSSAGEKSFGISFSGPLLFLMSRFALKNETIIDLEMPYHAGVDGNSNGDFQDVLNEVAVDLLANHFLGIGVTVIVFDANTRIIHGLNEMTLPRKCSMLLVSHALEQVKKPIDDAKYQSCLAAAYQRYPTWKSLRNRAVCWERSKA